jgi:hypothetical protein
VAVCTGLACTGTDWLLEPIAWKYRAWWLWYPGNLAAPDSVPWTSYLFWFIASTLLALAIRPTVLSGSQLRRPPQPAVVYGVMNAVFLATRLVG